MLFIFCIGAYVFLEQARTRKISWGCVLIPKKFKTVCEATISLERLFRRGNPPLRLAQQSFAFHSRVFRFRTCAERRAELGRLSVGILVLSCVQRGAWVVRSFGDRSSLVAQHKTYPLLFPAGEEILSKSEKAYRIVLARYPVVCRSRCTVSLDRHGVLNHARPVQCGFCSDGTASRKLVRTTTCANGCKCDYTICGDQDPYLKEHPEYRDENGYRRNRE